MIEFSQDEIVKLLDKIKNKDQVALEKLLDGLKPMVSSIVRGYFLVGGDDEDLMQEGMIGLYKAIQDYKEGSTTFSTFAYICVLRQVQMAVRSSLRKNKMSLNSYIPISNQGMIVVSNEDDDEEDGIYILSSDLNPEETYIEKEQKQKLSEEIKKQLSDFEYNVLRLYLRGFSHSDISDKLKKDIKSVSNAIARIRMKLQNYFGGQNVSSTLS